MPITITTKEGKKVKLPDGFRRFLAREFLKSLKEKNEKAYKVLKKDKEKLFKFINWMLTKHWKLSTLKKWIQKYKIEKGKKASPHIELELEEWENEWYEISNQNWINRRISISVLPINTNNPKIWLLQRIVVLDLRGDNFNSHNTNIKMGGLVWQYNQQSFQKK